MTEGMRTGATLGVLGMLLVVAALWGWRAMTTPLPDAAPPPICVDNRIRAGQQVFTGQVAVSVYNASRQDGLASRTMNQLVNRGFVSAGTGNAPRDTSFRGVQIWSDNPEDPAVQLVSRHFRRVEITSGPQLGEGVTVVVGDRRGKLRRKTENNAVLTSEVDATICSPPGSLD